MAAGFSRRGPWSGGAPWVLPGAALFALFALFALLGPSTPDAGAQPLGRALDSGPGGAPYASGELFVTYESQAAERAIERANERAGGQTRDRLPGVGARLVSFPEIKNERAREARERGLERRRRALENTPIVESADYNYLRQPSYTPDDELFGRQWALERIEAPAAWEAERGGGVRVGVVDTGIDQDHPDVAGKVAAQRDFVDDDATAEDNSGHGTHVSGTVAAATDNGRGVAGACPDCELLVAKGLSSSGGYDYDIAEGIVWATDNGADAINLSLGGPGESSTLRSAVDYAWERDVVVAAAAGNDDTDTKSYPAAFANAIAVSATAESGEPARFSNYGDWIDVAAPGVGILSTVPGGGYREASGTSMAAPHVAALAGLLSARGLSAEENRKRLGRSAEDLGPEGEDEDYGRGRINARRALGVEAEAGQQGAKSSPATYEGGRWGLRETLDGGDDDLAFGYGGDRRGTEPLMGDWDGDGKETVGIRRGNTFYLKNSNGGGEADIKFRYGRSGDEPIVGDWDGDGKETVGIRRGNTFYLKNENTGGGADRKFRYGKASDEPVTGDWNGDGADTAGIVRGNTFYLKNENSGGGADEKFRYGKASDEPVTGDWNGDGTDTAGVVRDGRWLLSNGASGGEADIKFGYGDPADTPLVW